MKRVFITGAAKRLGREAVRHLSLSGYKVIVHYNTAESDALSLQKETGCELFQADFSTIKIIDLKQRLEKEVGAIDALINNASSFQRAKWDDIREQLWDSELAVNLKVPFFL